MDLASILGLVLGATLVFLAVITTSDLMLFIDVASMLMVIGGAFAAALIKYSIQSYLTGIKDGFKTVFFETNEKPREIINLANKLARIARRNGLLGLEDEPIDNPFFKKGVQMCVDGSAPEFIQEVLQKDMHYTLERKSTAEHIFRSLSDLAPGFGMIGTLVGLIGMLSNLDDPTALGPGMAMALITTLYGSLMAQLVFIPMADKIESKIDDTRNNMSLIIDSVMGIYNGMNPQILDELLETYLPEYQRGAVDMEEEIE